MLKPSWTIRALDELDGIVAYIELRNPAAAQRIRDHVETAALRLPDFPFIHRSGRVPGTREAVVHPNYIVVYKVGPDEIEILNVKHARRQYP